MTKVYLRPDAATIEANNGIGRVVHAQARWLPAFDVELVGTPERADVVSGHTHDYGAGRIDHVAIHGFYWQGDAGSGEYDNWHREANTRIIAAMRRARAITVPSNWVGECVRRDMRIAPTIIGHGIEVDEWAPGENQGYVLWAKNRPSDVCNPIWPHELARRGVKVFSTFGPKGVERPATLGLLGELRADAMKEMLRRADVYLATTKETFGIQTLEAMSCGVPVLGFDWGGTADLVGHKQTGYLAQPGDIEGLLEGLAYIRAHRAELSSNAREFAAGYGWKQVIGKYAALYHQLAGVTESTGVAVVIPCHNYAQWVGECLESVLAQTYRVDEIIVVDDGSTDDSLRIAETYRNRGVNVIFQPNAGVSAARNNGIASTAQPFVICLDADDTLDPRYVEACRTAMLADRGLGLAWTGMSIVREGQPATANVWTGGFDWEWQATPRVPPATTIPTGAMFRRALWERAGGYRQQYAPGEDAEFYTRGLSVGFTARQVTDVPLYRYRDHGAGAHKRLVYKPIDDWKPWMRDRAYPLAAPAEIAPDVRSYSDPKVSVVIPVGPGHGQYLPDALESLLGQNMREWEVIVVNDGDDINCVDRFPFAKVVRASLDVIPSGPGSARNVGLRFAKAPLCLFLDADDQLAPGALAALCRAYADAGGRYVYGDWQAMGETQPVAEAEYNPAAWLDFDSPDGKHSVTVLMATTDAQTLKFDEQLAGWEDWDFFIRASLAGVHGQRVPAVTLFVRRDPNGRTARIMRDPAALLETLRNKYGGETVGKSCCGGNADALLAAKAAWNGTPAEQAGGLSVALTAKGRGSTAAPFDPNVMVPVRMEFVGRRSGAVTYPGVRGSGRQYRGGNNPINRFHNVHPADVGPLESTGDWRRVAPALSEVPETAPVKVDQIGPVVEPAAAQPAPDRVDFDSTVFAQTPDGGKAQFTLEQYASERDRINSDTRYSESLRVWAIEQLKNRYVEINGTEPVEVLAEIISEPVAVIQTAEGPVKRRVSKRAEKNTALKELPPSQ